MYLERSSQRLVPLSEDCVSEITSHPALVGLEAEAPPLDPSDYKRESIKFPFSNDEASVPYFDQLQARTLTPEYQEASSRVAILIGESGLAANLPYIPEETIIVLDSSSDMCTFMQQYIEGLRSCKTPQTWLERLIATGPSTTSELAEAQSYKWWEKTPYPHPLNDINAFKTAQTLARQKVIVPWHGDITNPGDMQSLGQILHSKDAAVTMMNLTNVIPYIQTKWGLNTESCIAQLRELPIGLQAPILATTHRSQRPHILSMQDTSDATLLCSLDYNLQIGPFFGLQNLEHALQREHVQNAFEVYRQAGTDSGLACQSETTGQFPQSLDCKMADCLTAIFGACVEVYFDEEPPEN